MAVIGSLNINVMAGVSQLGKQFASAQKSVTSFVSSATSSIAKIGAVGGALAGAAGIVGFGAALKDSFDSIDGAAKVADRLNITTESLQGLRHAADLSGVANDVFDASLDKMTKNLGTAAMKGGPVAAMLDHIGLNATKLANIEPDGAFLDIADALSKIENPAERAAAAQTIFGKSGQQLLNTLMMGRSGITDMMDEAKALGITFSRVDASTIEEANDNISRMRGAFKGLANIAAITLAPTISTVATGVIDFAKNARVYIGEILPTIQAVGSFAWNAFKTASSAVTGFISRNMELITTIGKVGAVIGSAVAVAWGLPAVFSALGAVALPVLGGILSLCSPIVVGLSAAGVAAIYFFGEGSTFGEKFNSVIATIPDLLSGIAFGFRNMGALSQVAIIDLQLAIYDLLPAAETVFQSIGAFIIATWDGSAAAFKAFFTNIIGGLKEIGNVASAVGAGIAATFDAIKSGNITGSLTAFGDAFTKTLASQQNATSGGNPFEAFTKAFSESQKNAMEGFASSGGLGNMLREQRDGLLNSIADAEAGRLDMTAADITSKLPDLSTNLPDIGMGDFSMDTKSKGEKKTTSAAELAGSKEAFSTLLRGAMGGKDPNAKTADNTKQSAKSLQSIQQLMTRQVQLAEDEETVDF